MNRSKFLSEYLSEKGYETRYVGVQDGVEREVTQSDIDWARVVIAVTPDIAERLRQKWELNGRRLIVLNVNDWPPEWRGWEDDLKRWNEHQSQHTYPLLAKQIDEYLPL